MAFEFQDGISELIGNLDDSSGATGSYWHMLKHAERHGFDLAVMKDDLHETLNRAWTWNDAIFDDARERELVLDLRDRMRMEMFLPPLSSTERAEWCWANIAPSRRYKYVGPSPMNGADSMTPEQIEATASYMRAHYPEAVRYLEAVRDDNAPLGFNGGPYDKYIVRWAWHFSFLSDSVCAIIGEVGAIRVDYNKIARVLAPAS